MMGMVVVAMIIMRVDVVVRSASFAESTVGANMMVTYKVTLSVSLRCLRLE